MMIRSHVFLTIIIVIISTVIAIEPIGATLDPRHELLTEIVGRYFSLLALQSDTNPLDFLLIDIVLLPDIFATVN